MKQVYSFVSAKGKELEAKREVYRQARQKRVQKNPLDVQLRNAKSRAKKKNIEFDITLDDLIQPNVCPVLGIPIHRDKPRSGNAPSIDRIDSDKGYIRGNVRIISNRANTLKSNATIEELELVLIDLKKIQESRKK